MPPRIATGTHAPDFILPLYLPGLYAALAPSPRVYINEARFPRCEQSARAELDEEAMSRGSAETLSLPLRLPAVPPTSANTHHHLLPAQRLPERRADSHRCQIDYRWPPLPSSDRATMRRLSRSQMRFCQHSTPPTVYTCQLQPVTHHRELHGQPSLSSRRLLCPRGSIAAWQHGLDGYDVGGCLSASGALHDNKSRHAHLTQARGCTWRSSISSGVLHAPPRATANQRLCWLP